MPRLRKLACALCLLVGWHTSAQAQIKGDEIRGELLYATHCNACHQTKIHWREGKLVTDLRSLKVQVRRWQSNSGLGWSEEDISDVTRYLNTGYYHFPVSGKRNAK